MFGFENSLGPSGMAIIGGACFVGAITQTFSAAVIMIELIDNIQLIVPLLIATVITICLSRFFTVCVYDKIAIDKKLPYMPDIQYTSGQTAEAIMDTELVMLQEILILKYFIHTSISIMHVYSTGDLMKHTINIQVI